MERCYLSSSPTIFILSLRRDTSWFCFGQRNTPYLLPHLESPPTLTGRGCMTSGHRNNYPLTQLVPPSRIESELLPLGNGQLNRIKGSGTKYLSKQRGIWLQSLNCKIAPPRISWALPINLAPSARRISAGSSVKTAGVVYPRPAEP